MKYSSLFLIVSFIYVAAATNNTPLHITVVLTTSDLPGDEYMLNYRHEEGKILLAAEKAAIEINNSSSILNHYEIELIPIYVSDSDPNHGVVKFVTELVSRGRNLVGIIGIFGDRFAKVSLPLAGLPGIDLIQLVDTTALNLDNSRQYPHTFLLYPLLNEHVRAAAFMFKELNWTQVGLVYSSTHYDPIYLRAAESFLAFIKLIDIRINITLIDIEDNVSSHSIIERVQQSGVFAFLTLLPQYVSAELICVAQHQGLQYAWVLVGDGVFNLEKNNGCASFGNTFELVEKTQLILIIQQLPYGNNSKDCTGLSGVYLNSNNTVTHVYKNPYAGIIHDSIWALALALNASLDTLIEANISLEDNGHRLNHNGRITEIVKKKLVGLEFSGTTGPISICSYSDTAKDMFEILQLQPSNYQRVGTFDSETNELTINVTVTIPGLRPRIMYTYATFPAELTTFLLLVVGLLFLLTTVILSVFVYFRNEPEVKSSSFRLSLCMFLGCYLIILSLFCHFAASGSTILAEGLRRFVCNAEQYLFSVGADLVVTTLLAKLIRVWRIFTLHGKTSKVWSDQYLLLFIGLVVLLKIVLLIIWTVADIYQLKDVEMLLSTDGINSYYKIVQGCDSEHYVAWILLVYGYSIAICLIVIAASIKTRKIKQENFKDTKKVSILFSSIIYIALVCGSLWAVLRLTGDSLASKVIIGIASFLVCLMIEVFLFLPKILPPLQRQFKITGIAHKAMSSSSHPTSSTLSSSLYS